MKVLAIGGTGFLGSRLVPRLQAKGHVVTVLTRSHEKARKLEEGGVQALVGDILEPASFREDLGPLDVMVWMAMPPVRVGRKISGKQYRSLQRVTTALFANALDLARQKRVPLVATSGASYRTRGGEVADETWPIDRTGLAGLGAGVDPLIEEAFRTGSPSLVLLLPGQIYGNGGLFRNVLYERMKRGRYGVIGSGSNCIPRIHVDDCAEAYVKAIEQPPISERLIVADDVPCTAREFSDYLSDCMGIPRPGRTPIPAFLMRLVMGEFTYRTVTMNCRVSNAKAKSVLGWQPAYPSYREGLPAVIAEIEREAATV